MKTQLLSQRPIAGVGNIYADEALWRARINPARRTVTRAQAAALLDALRDVLAGSLRYGGTTLSDYRTVDGREGRNQQRARRVRPGGPAVPALRHRAAVAHARRPHRDVVPDLPAPLTPARSAAQVGRRWTWRAPAWSRASTTSWSMFTWDGRAATQRTHSATSSAVSGSTPS